MVGRERLRGGLVVGGILMVTGPLFITVVGTVVVGIVVLTVEGGWDGLAIVVSPKRF